MENLEKLIYDLYKKNARQCTNEEIYNALLIYTKNQLFEKGYQDGKKKIYYISAEFLIGKLLSNNLINLGIYEDVKKLLADNGKQHTEIATHCRFRNHLLETVVLDVWQHASWIPSQLSVFRAKVLV